METCVGCGHSEHVVQQAVLGIDLELAAVVAGEGEAVHDLAAPVRRGLGAGLEPVSVVAPDVDVGHVGPRPDTLVVDVEGVVEDRDVPNLVVPLAVAAVLVGRVSVGGAALKVADEGAVLDALGEPCAGVEFLPLAILSRHHASAVDEDAVRLLEVERPVDDGVLVDQDLGVVGHDHLHPHVVRATGEVEGVRRVGPLARRHREGAGPVGQEVHGRGEVAVDEGERVGGGVGNPRGAVAEDRALREQGRRAVGQGAGVGNLGEGASRVEVDLVSVREAVGRAVDGVGRGVDGLDRLDECGPVGLTGLDTGRGWASEYVEAVRPVSVDFDAQVGVGGDGELKVPGVDRYGSGDVLGVDVVACDRSGREREDDVA